MVEVIAAAAAAAATAVSVVMVMVVVCCSNSNNNNSGNSLTHRELEFGTAVAVMEMVVPRAGAATPTVPGRTGVVRPGTGGVAQPRAVQRQQ